MKFFCRPKDIKTILKLNSRFSHAHKPSDFDRHQSFEIFFEYEILFPQIELSSGVPQFLYTRNLYNGLCVLQPICYQKHSVEKTFSYFICFCNKFC